MKASKTERVNAYAVAVKKYVELKEKKSTAEDVQAAATEVLVCENYARREGADSTELAQATYLQDEITARLYDYLYYL